MFHTPGSRNVLVSFAGVLLVLFLTLPAQARTSSAPPLAYVQGTLQTTRHGQVQGIVEGNALVWLGIPYAAPPVGELRWKAPRPPVRHQGVREAQKAAPRAIQVSGGKITGSEDCLYLNISRPNSRGTNLPVVLYLHGGNNQIGSSTSLLGENFAPQTHCVVVSIAYRLGVLGWLNVPALKTGDPLEDSGNFGLLDMIAALDWIKENIAAFGGDPENIALLGHSAGGRNAMALLISPLAAGKFHKVLSFSGGMTTASPEEGASAAYAAFAKWIVADKLRPDEKSALEWLRANPKKAGEYLRAQPAERLASAMTGIVIRMSTFPHLFTDGAVLPAGGFAAFEKGAYHKVPLIAACDAAEFSLFAILDPAFLPTFKEKTLLTGPRAAAFAFVNKYGSMLYASSNAERVVERLVRHQGDVYACRYAWGSRPEVFGEYGARTVGATHGVHVPFLEGKLQSGMTAFVPDMFRQENLPGFWQLQKNSNAYLRNFLHTGNPNGVGLPVWTPWTAEPGKNRIMVFDALPDKAVIGMSPDYIREEDVFAAMRADASLTKFDRELAHEVLSGRFFSESFDKTFMEK